MHWPLHDTKHPSGITGFQYAYFYHYISKKMQLTTKAFEADTNLLKTFGKDTVEATL